MSLNRNKSEILLQIDLKVFLVNTIRGREREHEADWNTT